MPDVTYQNPKQFDSDRERFFPSSVGYVPTISTGSPYEATPLPRSFDPEQEALRRIVAEEVKKALAGFEREFYKRQHNAPSNKR